MVKRKWKRSGMGRERNGRATEGGSPTQTVQLREILTAKADVILRLSLSSNICAEPQTSKRQTWKQLFLKSQSFVAGLERGLVSKASFPSTTTTCSCC